MNKFAGVLLSACLMSGSASWGLCKAVGNFVKNNPTAFCKGALLIGAPLAYGTFNYVNAFRQSAKSKKLIEQVLIERKTVSNELKSGAVQAHQDLSLKEKNLKINLIDSCIWGGLASALSTLFGARDPITLASVGVITTVSSTMDCAFDLSCAADMYYGELQAIPRMPH